jgi:hypothetical protein
VPNLCEAASVRPLHGKLTTQIRNVTAHTYSVPSVKDTEFFSNLCQDWLDAMALLGGFQHISSFLDSIKEPTLGTLEELLFGPTEPCLAA